MDEFSPEETELDIIGLIKYCLKRWIIAVIATLLGASIFCAAYMSTDRYSLDVYDGGASFYSITQFLDDNSNLINADSSAAEAVYNLTSQKIMSYMASEAVKGEFLKKEEVLADMRIIFDKPQRKADHDFKREFVSSFEITSSTYNFSITFRAKLDTEQKKESALRLMNLYIDEAILYAYTNIGNTNIPYRALEKLDPVERIKDGTTLLSEIVTCVAKGMAVGFGMGVVTILLIYFFDPRIKNIKHLNPICSAVYLKKGSDTRDAALDVLSRVKGHKTIMLASPQRDIKGLMSILSKNAAAELASLGYKTLLVDLVGEKYEGTTLYEYYTSKTLPLAHGHGYDVLGAVGTFGWTDFIAKGDRIQELKAKYDKIILSYQYEPRCGAYAVAQMSDTVVLVIDEKSTHLKAVNSLIADMEKPNTCVIACVYNG